ncbi:hypothetical protein QFC20_000826 [Naganishia adeliensis]|uniref:Uncharacterized protein n=1 Tax=Naganishia adeliensis TaxID=92952 RepID=A0ACC2WYC3_9TREE|nr:hypothetical protein QFC20_000826 [Naganishia adeliensis]
MPQPPLSLEKYLAAALPPVKENFPAGGGATGARESFEGNLKGISVIPDFEAKVQQFVDALPTQPLVAHPTHPFPHFLNVLRDLPPQVKNAQDVQKYLKQIPLAAISASLTALKASEEGIDYSKIGGNAPIDRDGKKLDAAGYESVRITSTSVTASGKADAHPKSEAAPGSSRSQQQGTLYGWRFSKSPMGSGEFLLIDESKPEEVKLVVRTINSSAFSNNDWKDLVVDGAYDYNTKSKASWYWSRKYGATKRLGCNYFVFTDYQKWCFGVFTEGHSHANISPVMSFEAGKDGKSPSVLEALLYWSRSALGEKGGFQPAAKDVSSEHPYQNVQARKKTGNGQVEASNESDIEE